MTRINFVSRLVTVTALVALAVTVGVWLTRSPLTAAPTPAPAKPTVAPLPPGTTEVEVSYEIVPPTPAVALPQSDTKIVAFTATWCAPCQRARLALAQIQATGVGVEIIDIDRQPDLARQHNIARVPTFLVFTGTKVVLRTHDVAAVAARIEEHGILGVILDSDTARIKSVQPRSAAEKAGIEVGDIIGGVNGVPTPATADILAALRHYLPGAAVCLDVRRGESSLMLTAVLDAPPAPSASPKPEPPAVRRRRR